LPLKSRLKKKNSAINFEQSPSFTPVNRSTAYLKKSALAYGKKKGLSSALFRLYDAHNLVSYERKKSLPVPAPTNKTKKKVPATPAVRALKKETQLLCPLKKGSFSLSSKFGPRRRTNGSWGFHKGLDMAAPEGTPIKAAATGEVLEAGWSKGYGNTVLIAHSPSLTTRYAHLSKISVTRGTSIKEGEIIGLVGNTGRVRSSRRGGGHHLHFEVHLYGKAVNPLYFISRS
jgi:murein DD-endopeptidase MepM/ murein hydrolase activator NlpD